MNMTEITIYTISREEIKRLDYTRFDRTIGKWADIKGRKLRERFDSLIIIIDGYTRGHNFWLHTTDS